MGRSEAKAKAKAKESWSNIAMEKAYEFYDKPDYDTAIKYCSLAIKINPKNGMAYNLRGAMYTHNYWFTWSFRDLNKAISLGFTNECVYSNLGDAYRLNQQCDKAVNNYSIALEMNPDHFYAWLNRGFTFTKMKLYEKAIPDLKKALSLIPNDKGAISDLSSAYLGRGNLHLKEGKNLKAVEDFTKAIKLEGFLVEAYEGRSIAFTNIGKIDEANADMVKAKFFRDE
jgi:tetratricopeptide (TPR) repeat protein